MSPRRSSFVFLAGLFVLAACSGPAQPRGSGPTVLVSSTERAACETIAIACDPHDQKGGLAKDCRDLALSPSTPAATCVARRAECVAACPYVR